MKILANYKVVAPFMNSFSFLMLFDVMCFRDKDPSGLDPPYGDGDGGRWEPGVFRPCLVAEPKHFVTL